MVLRMWRSSMLILKDAAEKRKKKRKPPQKLFDADAIRLIFLLLILNLFIQIYFLRTTL